MGKKVRRQLLEFILPQDFLVNINKNICFTYLSRRRWWTVKCLSSLISDLSVLPGFRGCVDLFLPVSTQQCPCQWKYGLGYHGNHILLFLQTEMDQQRQRCKESAKERERSGSQRNTLKHGAATQTSGGSQLWDWLTATVLRDMKPVVKPKYIANKAKGLFESCWWASCGSWLGFFRIVYMEI